MLIANKEFHSISPRDETPRGLGILPNIRMVQVTKFVFGNRFQGSKSREIDTRLPSTLTRATPLPARHPGTYLRRQGAGRSAQGLGTVVHGLGCKVKGLLSRASQPCV